MLFKQFPILSFSYPPVAKSDHRQHMNLSTVESKQWTPQQGSSIAEESELVVYQYDPVVETHLLTKHRCDDVVSSSATRGSESTAGASKHQMSSPRTATSPTSNGQATDDGEDNGSTRESSADPSNRAHMFDDKTLPTDRSSGEDRPYCLDRYVRDIDAREKARLGNLRGYRSWEEPRETQGRHRQTERNSAEEQRRPS